MIDRQHWCVWRSEGDTACGAGMNQVVQEFTHREERVNLAGLGGLDFQKKLSFGPDSPLGPGRWALRPGDILPSKYFCAWVLRAQVPVGSQFMQTMWLVVSVDFCSGDWSLISWGHLSRCCIPDWPLITIWTLMIEPTFLIKTTLHMLSWVTVEKHSLAAPLGEDSGFSALCHTFFSLLIPPVFVP